MWVYVEGVVETVKSYASRGWELLQGCLLIAFLYSLETCSLFGLVCVSAELPACHRITIQKLVCPWHNEKLLLCVLPNQLATINAGEGAGVLLTLPQESMHSMPDFSSTKITYGSRSSYHVIPGSNSRERNPITLLCNGLSTQWVLCSVFTIAIV